MPDNRILKAVLYLALTLEALFSMAQDLPYREIPDYPEQFTAETVTARTLDGLGVRYYWATEGLRQEDLQYRPSEEARSTRVTLEHIYGLTLLVRNTIFEVPHQSEDVSGLTFNELRKQTLDNILLASNRLKSDVVLLQDIQITFAGSDSNYPFWNHLNGPIADALWHCGQVVSFRRSSGNPFDPAISLFQGKLRK